VSIGWPFRREAAVRPEPLTSSGPQPRSGLPGSDHVRTIGLDEATDLQVWQYARDHQFIVVSKDDDEIRQLAFLHGAPPKVIWLRVGNGPTTAPTFHRVNDSGHR
jgi:hypothetical protein